MPRRSRKLRVCKWAGTVGCVLIVVAFVGSARWNPGFAWTSGQDARAHGIWLDHGTVTFGRDVSGFSNVSGWFLDVQPSKGGQLLDSARLPSRLEFREFGKSADFVLLPLWLPFLVLLIPTLLLWRRDRRKPRPGFCRRCDYDLTGNTSGRCPECGLEIAA